MLAGRDREKCSVNVEPYLDKGGIVDPRAVGADDERLVRLYVIVNFDIGRVPRVVLSRELLADLLYSFPIVFSVKLKAVPPDV